MEKLFSVRTSGFKTHYTLANGYDEAAKKVLRYLERMELDRPVVTKSGDLSKKDPRDYDITDISVLTDNLIK